jgi:outer membrane protein assembly factor BamB
MTADCSPSTRAPASDWKSGDSTKPGYAAPVFFKHKGKEVVAAFSRPRAGDLQLGRKGKPVFNFGWRTSYDINASNPQYHDGAMFLASGYGMGYVVIDVSGSKPKILHKDEDTPDDFPEQHPAGRRHPGRVRR